MRKKFLGALIGVLLIGLLPLGVLAAAAPPTNESGYYELDSYDDLVWFQEYVDAGNLNINAILTADIVANENLLDASGEVQGTPTYTWTPISKNALLSSKSYSGTFDGDGHTISGLYVMGNGDNDAFFAQCNGTIQNLMITDSYFGKWYHAATFVGTGSSNCKIINCASTATVQGSYCIDGIAGETKGEITNCYFAGKIEADNNYSNAIATDYNWGTLTNCYYLDTCGKTSTRATAVTAAQLASGEVAYKLNGDQSSIVWKQTIGTDDVPNFTSETVYEFCNGTEIKYSNTSGASNHVYTNGICICGAGEPAKQDENGTYQIANYGNLVWFGQYVDAGNTDINAVLTADITANENLLDASGEVVGAPKYSWTPIGKNADYETSFSGILDGNGHSISGLYVTGYDDNDALFALCNGTIKNLIIKDSCFDASYHTSTFVGYGYSDSKIINCASTATVNGSLYTGGIAGETVGEITNCYFAGKIEADNNYSNAISSDYYNCGTLTNCYYLNSCGKTSERATAVTAEQLASGEVAYKLNGEKSEGVWKQTIGTDSTPNFTGDTVYYGYADCDAIEMSYANTTTGSDVPGHTFTDGICTACEYCPFTESVNVTSTSDFAVPENLEKVGHTTDLVIPENGHLFNVWLNQKDDEDVVINSYTVTLTDSSGNMFGEFTPSKAGIFGAGSKYFLAQIMDVFADGDYGVKLTVRFTYNGAEYTYTKDMTAKIEPAAAA